MLFFLSVFLIVFLNCFNGYIFVFVYNNNVFLDDKIFKVLLINLL